MEFMRSKIKGSRIKEVRQAGKNRIIFFELEHSGITYYMYVRLWSGASNIIITDKNNIIQDVFYRRPGKKEITGGVFTLPEEKESARIFQIRDYDNSHIAYSNPPEPGKYTILVDVKDESGNIVTEHISYEWK